MILKADKIKEMQKDQDGLTIIPEPDFNRLLEEGAASLDLRLGRWFLGLRQSSTTQLDLTGTQQASPESEISKKYFVPFGAPFFLHPGRFILGATLEWIRLPSNVSGYVTGKSSLGRRGLVIETAAGIHPGFSGCLTLEFANLGEAPVQITPGMKICQIFLHQTTESKHRTESTYSGRRRPAIGAIKPDPILTRLQESV